MGSGKSTVLKLLKSAGLNVAEEPARRILAEQRNIGDEGLPNKNPKLFIQLLLSRAIYQYTQAQDLDEVIVYDRGIPDIIAYAQLFNLDYLPAQTAAKLYRYETTAFIFPAWKDIYITDDERIMSYEAAENFGISIQKVYQQYAYKLVEVPCISPQERVNFIMERLK